jgi:hypothetical protein
MIRGNLLLFADWQWTVGKEKTAIEGGKRLLALATAAAWVRWWDGKPTQHILRQPGKQLPARDALGDLDESAWQVGPDGEPRDPWQSTRYVYFVDPETEEAYTYITASGGGRNAVSDLGDQIQRKRHAHPSAVPVVELGAAPMPTKYGRKSKPVLKVVGWVREEEPETAPPPKTVTARKVITVGDMDDEIPFVLAGIAAIPLLLATLIETGLVL